MDKLKNTDLFRNVSFLTGLIGGILLLVLTISGIINDGFDWGYLGVYSFIFCLILITVDESKNAFMFFLALGLPYLLITLLIFFIVDIRNKKQHGKKY